MVEKIPTGIAGLDLLLKGGLLPNASVLVEGTPGTGKSTLAMQFIAEGVKLGQPGVIITLEEYPSEFYRDALNYGWDLVKWQDENKVRVVATSPEALKHQIEMGGPLAEEIHTIGAKRIVVDSVTHFERISGDPGFLRTAMSGLIHSFKIEEMLSLFTKDYEAQSPFEFWGRYSVDVLIELSFRLLKSRERHRFIEVHKARGQDHILGLHSFRITDRGIQIYPRATPELTMATRETRPEIQRVTSGVDGLDAMLAGGFFRGQSILVAGSAGTGKSLIAASFANTALTSGEGVLYISTEDQPSRLMQNAQSIGIDLRPAVSAGNLDLLYVPPVELSPDELLFEVEARLDSGKYQRLVIDSISSLRGVSPEPEYLRDVIIALQSVCFKRDVAGMFTAEIEAMTGPFRFTEFGASFVADVVVLLRQVEVSGQIRKSISVIKIRGSRHDPSLKELVFTSAGLKIGAPFENLSGILTGIATAQRPVGVEPYFGEVTPEQQTLVTVLSDRKESTADEVAEATGMDADRVRDLLEDLVDRGFVTRTTTDGELHYRPALMRARA